MGLFLSKIERKEGGEGWKEGGRFSRGGALLLLLLVYMYDSSTKFEKEGLRLRLRADISDVLF
jgi:hypothetical protein